MFKNELFCWRLEYFLEVEQLFLEGVVRRAMEVLPDELHQLVAVLAGRRDLHVPRPVEVHVGEGVGHPVKRNKSKIKYITNKFLFEFIKVEILLKKRD